MATMTLTKAQYGFTLSCNCGCMQSELIHSSDDYVPLAEDFGFGPVEANGRDTAGPTDDGAYSYLCDHAGDTIDDPGYFDAAHEERRWRNA